MSDVFGRALWDWDHGGTTPELYERRDGLVTEGAGPEFYFAGIRRWPPAERQAIRYARGRVADVGCGGGRVALHLQGRGRDVVGLDTSPLALRTARHRGVDRVRRLSLEDLAGAISRFDTVVLFGNNFGLFGTPGRARRLLTSWAGHATPGTRILAESTSPHFGGAPAVDRRGGRANRARGRLPGQTRLRIRYGDEAGPWHDWLFVSRSELEGILDGTGWRVTVTFSSGPVDPYVALVELDG
jgi:SAM-dependent methyltransferase